MIMKRQIAVAALLAASMVWPMTGAFARSDAKPAARGFASDDLTRFAKDRVPSGLPATRQQLAHADVIRIAIAGDPRRSDRILSRSERILWDVAFGPPSPLREARLQWFMRGAIGYAAPGSDVTGLYSAIADTWLVMRWRSVGHDWRIANLILVPGPALRTASDGPVWTYRSGNSAQAIVDQRSVAFARFAAIARRDQAARLFAGLVPNRARLRAISEGQLDRWLGTTTSWLPGGTNADAWRTLRTRLMSRKGLTDGSLGGLPNTYRATLVPAAEVSTTNGRSLLLVSPLDPNAIVFADFVGGKTAPELRLLNLANAPIGIASTEGEN